MSLPPARPQAQIRMDQTADIANTASPDTDGDHQIARLPAVLQLTGLSRSTLYVLMAGGSFPQSVRLSQRTMGWKISEVRAWLAHRAAEHRYRVAARDSSTTCGGGEA